MNEPWLELGFWRNENLQGKSGKFSKAKSFSVEICMYGLI